jgi:hypothetical protein
VYFNDRPQNVLVLPRARLTISLGKILGRPLRTIKLLRREAAMGERKNGPRTLYERVGTGDCPAHSGKLHDGEITLEPFAVIGVCR